MEADTVTAREAGFVAGVSFTAVNRAIDEKKLPAGMLTRSRQRLLTRQGVLMLAVEKELEHRVSPTARNRIRRRIAGSVRDKTDLEGLGEVQIIEGPLRMVVSLDIIAKSVDRNWRRLRDAMSLIVEDSDIQAGAATFRGTRILVRPIAAAVARGIPETELLEDYPALTAEMIEAAKLFANVRPQRGRPSAKLKSMEPRSQRHLPRP